MNKTLPLDSHQIIIFGPPGSGKSYYVRELIKEKLEYFIEVEKRPYIKEKIDEIITKKTKKIVDQFYEHDYSNAGEKEDIEKISKETLDALAEKWGALSFKNEEDILKKIVDYKYKILEDEITSRQPAPEIVKKIEELLKKMADNIIKQLNNERLKFLCKEVFKKLINENIFETCFHPEYKYGDFVGRLVPYTENGKVTYKFIEGDLTKALKKAYKNYAENESHPTSVFLIIDELNRGNSSAIFGKFFNLLDRDENGWSVYSVEVDELTGKTLLSKDLVEKINNSSKDNDNLKKIKELIEDNRFKRVKFPPNFYIIATINTSDESIFYMDTAFKRRWEWYYMDEENKLRPDIDACRNGNNEAEMSFCVWQIIRVIINNTLKDENLGSRIRGLEDKILGYYFAGKNDPLCIPKVANKVAFHLWDSVFRQNRGLAVEFFNLLYKKAKKYGIQINQTNKKYIMYSDVLTEIKEVIEQIKQALGDLVEEKKYIQKIILKIIETEDNKVELQQEFGYLIKILCNLNDINQKKQLINSIYCTFVDPKIELIPAYTIYDKNNPEIYYHGIFVKYSDKYIKKSHKSIKKEKKFLPTDMEENFYDINEEHPFYKEFNENQNGFKNRLSETLKKSYGIETNESSKFQLFNPYKNIKWSYFLYEKDQTEYRKWQEINSLVKKLRKTIQNNFPYVDISQLKHLLGINELFEYCQKHGC